ncbi:MAG: hypothetical protein V3T05_10840 [Myxococcota bacterium]
MRKILFSLTILTGASASLALALTACGDGDDAPTSCTADFDCAVGKLCKDGTCADAVAGDERDFGQVEMSFADGSEYYLLAVYALPTAAEAAGSDLVSFELSAGGAPAGALRLGADQPDREPAYDADDWQQRIEFEGKRREGIDRLAADLRAGRVSLDRAVPKEIPCGGCPADQYCQGTCTSTPSFSFIDGTTLNTTVLGTAGVGNVDITMLLDNGFGGADAPARAAALEFAKAADAVLAALGQSGGHGGDLDLDGDGQLAVIFTEKVGTVGGGGIVGFFDFNDFLSTGTGSASGNEADILWSRVPTKVRADCPATDGCASSVITHEVAVGTLVHEYTHLVNYAVRVHAAGAGAQNEVLWLDEGMAHLMEDLTGWGSSNIGIVASAFDDWPTATFGGPDDTTMQRGASYLLLRHLLDTQARASGSTSAAGLSPTLHGTLLGESELGWLHPTLQNAGASGVWHWLLGMFATNNTDVTESGANAYDYLSSGTHTGTAQMIGLDPRGTYLDARNAEIILDGPTLGDGVVYELTDFVDPLASEVAVSGSLLFLVTGLDAGTTTLTGRGAAEVDLQMRAMRVW